MIRRRHCRSRRSPGPPRPSGPTVPSSRSSPPSPRLGLGRAVVATAAVVLLSASHLLRGAVDVTDAFSTAPLAFVSTKRRSSSPSSSRCGAGGPLQMSSVGGGEDNNNFGGDDDDENNPLNEWISRRESENVRRVREQFAEGRLPISYGAMNAEGDDDDGDGGPQAGNNFGPLGNATSSSSTSAPIDATASPSSSSLSTASSNNDNEANPYLRVVSRLAPSDLIARFTSTASPRVQDAVRTTVLGLIGGLPQMAFSTKTVATGERLASLMFQLQMTGYMFKNAEYRSSLSRGLGGSEERMQLPGSSTPEEEDEAARAAVREGRGRIEGKIKVRYGGGGGSSGSDASDDADEGETPAPSMPGLEVEVDAKAYMSELRGEVSRLRDELDATKQAKEEEIRKDLLTYIRTLPQQELQQLTGTMSPEVLDAMKGLVSAVLAGIGEDEEDPLAGGGGGGANGIGPDTVTEQSGEALAQLCMWQLVVGFNLRELEVREEFRAKMTNALGESGGGVDERDGEGGVQFGPGALE